MKTPINRAARIAYAQDLFRRSIDLKETVLADHCEVIADMAEEGIASLAAGGKLLLCGNGGSAADAQHLAAELLVRLRPHVDRVGIPAVALTLDTSSMTACGNDYSFEGYFERMTRTLGKPGDILIGITTSGMSVNVTRAMQAAREIDMCTFGFLGNDGGEALARCDLALVVPSDETGRIQEVHITAGHALMELIEEGLLERLSVQAR